jgi:hypothetical protein
MTRTIDDILGNQMVVAVLESLRDHIAQTRPDGKVNHPAHALGACAIQRSILLRKLGLGEITFPELKEKYPDHYSVSIGYIQKGIDNYEFRV